MTPGASISTTFPSKSSDHRSRYIYMYDTGLRAYEHKSTKTNHRVTKSFTSAPAPHDSFECSHATIDLGVFALDPWLHNARVSEDDDG